MKSEIYDTPHSENQLLLEIAIFQKVCFTFSGKITRDRNSEKCFLERYYELLTPFRRIWIHLKKWHLGKLLLRPPKIPLFLHQKVIWHFRQIFIFCSISINKPSFCSFEVPLCAWLIKPVIFGTTWPYWDQVWPPCGSKFSNNVYFGPEKS